ncbi:DUF2997 domain-containing protein [Rosistilla oblonga]|uniref:DUF2997 domain-containing protein n=1 Tax=Rosistilla oblonga TaxID=2527990 RepID=A0A518IQI3_9BACT|nr:DUF2997 domain-containing protein [Rosistilla oblonga]QDV55347.1 hypothetical protein Mal33_13180 [Rosistilla oblonga]
MKTIEITIAADGNSRVETKGFTGTSCRDASRFLEASLGATKTEKLTDGFYATNSQIQQETESPN